MRTNLLLFIILGFIGCSTDGLIPCSEGGVEGKLCKEYRFLNDAPQGYVSFEHGGDSVLTSRFFNSASQLQKTIVQRFEGGKTSIIAEQWPEKESSVRTYHYNEMDSLAFVYYGANDSVMELSYEDGKRKRVAIFHQGELKRYDEYRYFLDDGKLYRIYSYNDSDSLLSYLSYEYFSSGHVREAHYTADNTFLGRRTFSFAPNGLITSVEFTDSLGQVSGRIDYFYEGLRLTEKTSSSFGNTSKSEFLYY